ncbi:hypothetical protein DCS_02284 [Drechmeria coniospora]|uniref:Nudix hydrolase domain-containing protein n=1 Tax=Drechmeria coniospora TaxID=98403 RepID=A0A151GVR9_DRECN|nr:hypothetical protein DCS_02284 [Drechmeria coniospora]KYK61143.1 hypothetical protein DCS_02284 [Drechmeria coniospora]
MAALKKREVAGSFIFKFPDGDASRRPKVALFKRSGAVSTYQHKYAPIAGGVEASDASPLATAWREIGEETGLTPSSLRLFRQGKPYSFGDPSVEREWTINPFAFILDAEPAAEARITLDWEHEGFAWFDPADVEDDTFPGVPRLRESLRRVWFELDLGHDAGTLLGRGLRALQQDHESGARLLADKALGLFVDVLPRLEATPTKDAWWRTVRTVAWHIWKNGRESMGAPILNALLAALAVIERKLPAGQVLPGGFVDTLLPSVKDLVQQGREASTCIATSFATFLRTQVSAGADRPIRMLTLSSSGTVTASLGHALASAESPLHIRILESRPLFEGTQTARHLAPALSPSSSKISLYADAAAGVAARNAHVVLLGADLIDGAGNVSNKVGSLPAVLAARHVSPAVKVAVLAEKAKILPVERPVHEEENDAAELTRSWDGTVAADVHGEAVDVRNVYFEWVPAALIDCYITEDGIMTRQHMEAAAADAKRRADRFFADL